MKKTLSIDFDGVLHEYNLGWKGPRNIYGDPVVDYATSKTAVEWLTELVACGKFEVSIFSSRSRFFLGRRAMKKWLLKHGINKEVLRNIKWPTKKPPAHLTIDDRAMTFTGKFPSLDYIYQYRPWNKKADRPVVICLCGSPIFEKEIEALTRRETLSGNIVLPLSGFCGVISPMEAKAIDNLHLRKIDIADELYVMNVASNITASMQNEIDYAKKVGKTIRYWGPQV